MPSKTFILGITVLAVVIIIGGSTWTFLELGKTTTPNQPDNSTPDLTPSEEPENESPEETPGSENSTDVPSGYSGVTVEQVKDVVMAYIKSAHPETAQFMTENMTWNGGRLPPESLESEIETYVYHAPDWTVTVEWPLVSNPTYKVTAGYSLEATVIIWQGTYQNAAIKETSFSLTR